MSTTFVTTNPKSSFTRKYPLSDLEIWCDTIFIDGKRYRRRITQRRKEKGGKCKVFVSCPRPEDLGWMDMPAGSNHESVWKLYEKLNTELKTQALQDVKIFNNARWSRKAGCSCGCSPGFNIPDTYTFFDFFVDCEAY